MIKKTINMRAHDIRSMALIHTMLRQNGYRFHLNTDNLLFTVYGCESKDLTAMILMMDQHAVFSMKDDGVERHKNDI